MNEIRAVLSSPAWWFTLIIGSLLLNVFANYLRDWIDRQRQALTHRSSARQRRRIQILEERANRLTSDGTTRAAAFYLIGIEKMSTATFGLAFLCLVILAAIMGGVFGMSRDDQMGFLLPVCLMVAVIMIPALLAIQGEATRCFSRGMMTKDELAKEGIVTSDFEGAPTE